MPSSSTERIGPMLHSATRPKLSLVELRSLRTEAMPTPNAMINGTVMGPVVTPPASKEMGMKSLGARAARAKASR